MHPKSEEACRAEHGRLTKKHHKKVRPKGENLIYCYTRITHRESEPNARLVQYSPAARTLWQHTITLVKQHLQASPWVLHPTRSG